jgi:hypothetical protein
MKRWLWSLSEPPVLWAMGHAVAALLGLETFSAALIAYARLIRWYVPLTISFWAIGIALPAAWRWLRARWELGNSDYRRAMADAKRDA